MGVTSRESPRIRWAVEALGIGPGERVLEIGCGQGVAVSLVCDELTTGTIVAVDRSAKMTAMARKRNAGCVEAGKAEIVTGSFPGYEFGSRRFDTIFAIHVGVFWQNPGPALAGVRGPLEKEGEFSLIFQPLQPAELQDLIDRAVQTLEGAGFCIARVLTEEIEGGPIACVTGQLA